MDILLLYGLALALDLTMGELPVPVHPVVWMGKTVSFLEKPGHRLTPAGQLVYGSVMVLTVVVLFSVPVYFLLGYLKGINPVLFYIAGAGLLKTTFSLKELRRAALRVKEPIVDGKLDQARFELRALVKRDTSNLPEPLVVSAVVESVSENTSDSVVAPWLYFLIGGVPGAIAYRVVNTMDAMIGYHGKYEYLGKFAARADTVLNLVPARLTALLLVAGAFLTRRDGRGAWLTALAEHSRTASPNAGWPMAACAGALGVRLEKVGHYILGKGEKPLIPDTIDASVSLMQAALVPGCSLVILAGVVSYALAR